jgi:ectoine hydroxylase-related dioxygenase (phytanoyl-CoA dioxygenase family)
MRTDVTDEEIAFYRANGYVKIEGLLNAEEVADWKAAVLKAVEGYGDRRITPGRPDRPNNDAYFKAAFVQKQNFWQAYEHMRPLSMNENMARMGAKLAGASGLRLYMDQSFIKQPGGNPTHWHIDMPFHHYKHEKSLAVWVALDDTTVENGCLNFLPGTHKEEPMESPRFSGNFGDIFDLYPKWREIAPAPVQLKAGDCTFHNEYVAHCAGPNLTNRPRTGFSVIYMPDGSRWNGIQACLTPEQAGTLKEGDLLDDPRQNPLLWSEHGQRDGFLEPDFERYHSSAQA